MQVFELFNGHTAPSSLGAFGGLCLLGGPMSVNDDWSPLRDGERLILEALRIDVPVFGHCLGGQLMSRVLGGQVTTGRRSMCRMIRSRTIGWARRRSRCSNGTARRSVSLPRPG